MRIQYCILATVIALSAVAALTTSVPNRIEVSDASTPAQGWMIGANQSELTRQLDLEKGDILLEINGTAFSGTLDEFQRVRKQCLEEQQVSVVFQRNGKIYKRSGRIIVSDAEKPSSYEFGTNLLERSSTP